MVDIQIGITSRVTGVARHLTQDIDSIFQRQAFDSQEKNNTAYFMLMNRAKAIIYNSTLLLVMQYLDKKEANIYTLKGFYNVTRH